MSLKTRHILHVSSLAIALLLLGHHIYDSYHDYRVTTNPNSIAAQFYNYSGSTVSLDSSNGKIVPAMALVQGGTFGMGCDTCSWDDEKPVHKVTVSSFMIGEYEVTVAQFGKFIAATGYKTTADTAGRSFCYNEKKWSNVEWSQTKGKDINWKFDAEGTLLSADQYNNPVLYISWYDAGAYCKWLSQATGKTYRLPTEAEWEYAARSASQTGNKASAASAFKLYDINTTVFEWCSDWYSGDYYAHSTNAVEPLGPPTGTIRVLRNGCLQHDKVFCLLTRRYHCPPDFTCCERGFRVVCNP